MPSALVGGDRTFCSMDRRSVASSPSAHPCLRSPRGLRSLPLPAVIALRAGAQLGVLLLSISYCSR